MKYRKFGILLLSVVLLASLVSCDVIQDFIKSRTRNIALIKLYNSCGVETKYIQPNDTLYIEAQGLAPGKLYRVTCKDPEGKELPSLPRSQMRTGISSVSRSGMMSGWKKER